MSFFRAANALCIWLGMVRFLSASQAGSKAADNRPLRRQEGRDALYLAAVGAYLHCDPSDPVSRFQVILSL